ncbi:hypothetical protein LINPERHAP1_LOCUS41156 [Linum perenne]
MHRCRFLPRDLNLDIVGIAPVAADSRSAFSSLAICCTFRHRSMPCHEARHADKPPSTMEGLSSWLQFRKQPNRTNKKKKKVDLNRDYEIVDQCCFRSTTVWASFVVGRLEPLRKRSSEDPPP